MSEHPGHVRHRTGLSHPHTVEQAMGTVVNTAAEAADAYSGYRLRRWGPVPDVVPVSMNNHQ